jgi:hypothetical protein
MIIEELIYFEPGFFSEMYYRGNIINIIEAINTIILVSILLNIN